MPTTPLRRRLLAAAGGAVIAAAGLAGCTTFGPPRSIVLDEAELQGLVDRAFPIDRRLLDVLDVSVTAPKLQLLTERNRIGTELAVSTHDRLFGGQWAGRITLDSALRWEAGDQTLRLAQVRVHQLSLDGGGSLARSQAERIGAVLAERLLENMVLWRLPPERAERLHRHGVTPGTLEVTRRGLEITLVPVPR